MPIIEPANTQQVLQMSSFVEKIQQGQQQVHHSINNYLNEERAALDEVKRSEIQEPESMDAADPANPDSGSRGRHGAASKRMEGEAQTGKVETNEPLKINTYKGANIDVMA
ncbi:MAG: hypothetical protein IIA62_03615 [Nitrospinae bacterium]|nr:hypothetical protein [Nitrospinota bacterium]